MSLYKKILSLFSGRLLVPWILSYIIIFFIPFVNNIYTYSRTEREVRQRISDNDSLMLRNMQQTFDKEISGFSAIAAGIQNNEYISKLFDLRPDMSEFDVNRLQAARSLSVFTGQNRNISDIYVYLNKSRFCISPGYTGYFDSFFPFMYERTDADIDELKQRFGTINYASYIVSQLDGGGTAVDFLYSIPIASNMPKATVVIRFSSNLFEQTIEQYADMRGKPTFVTDTNNTVIFASHPGISAEYGSVPDGISSVGGSRSMSIACTSPLNKWKYVSLTPPDVISGQLSYLRMPMLLSIIATMLLALLLIIYFVRKNYAPIRKIVNTARSSGTYSGKSEYEMISTILNDYTHNRKRLKDLSHHEMNEKKSRLLSSLASDGKCDLSELSRHGIEFVSDYFCIICFSITNASHLFSGDTAEEHISDEKTAETIQFIMSNVIEELIERCGRGYMTETDGHMLCIMSFAPEHLANWRVCVSDIISEAKQFIEENFMFSFKASVSDLHKGTGALPAAYWEADKTMSYRSFIRNEDIMLFEDMTHSASANYFSEETERNLISFLKLGNLPVAQSIVDGIFSNNDIGVNGTYLVTLKIAAAVSSEILNSGSAEYSELLHCLDDLMTARGSYTSTRDRLYRLLECACDILKAQYASEEVSPDASVQNDRSADSLLEKVKEYIGQNYRNSDLHLITLGEYFDITPYYLSNIFKKTEGITLIDYISKKRIEEAKRLMDTSSAPLTEIAEKTGFNNIRTFSRAFRKFEGISPGQYKELK